ncbi:MAG: DNA-binding domain-containing protein [Gammaproteobacteria bacterium]|jgi:hypothetical protein
MLAQTQHLFYQAIFDDDIDLDFIASSDAKQRFAIYRRNIFETLRNKLALTFPGVWILLGERCANSVARAFIQTQQYLSHQPCLHLWGAQFPAFLENLPELTTLPYLKDYAEFEWRKHLAYYAADAEPINPHVLQALSEDDIADVEIVFLPSLYLLTSPFSLQDIQEIVNNPQAPKIDLKNQITTVVIAKLNHHVISIFIPTDIGLFFQYLSKQQSLQNALQYTQNQYPDFDLQAALYILIKYQLIWKIK